MFIQIINCVNGVSLSTKKCALTNNKFDSPFFKLTDINVPQVNRADTAKPSITSYQQESRLTAPLVQLSGQPEVHIEVDYI